MSTADEDQLNLERLSQCHAIPADVYDFCERLIAEKSSAEGRAPVWHPDPLEVIENCTDASLKRAASLLRSTGNAGDAIDASRLEWMRKSAEGRAVATPIGYVMPETISIGPMGGGCLLSTRLEPGKYTVPVYPHPASIDDIRRAAEVAGYVLCKPHSVEHTGY